MEHRQDPVKLRYWGSTGLIPMQGSEQWPGADSPGREHRNYIRTSKGT